MTIVGLSFASVLALQSAAYAQNEVRSDIPRATSSGSGHSQNNEVSQGGRGTSGSIVINANSCAPDRADPVWGRNSVLLGYSCSVVSANGG
jgi:hypothetical protein